NKCGIPGNRQPVRLDAPAEPARAWTSAVILASGRADGLRPFRRAGSARGRRPGPARTGSVGRDSCPNISGRSAPARGGFADALAWAAWLRPRALARADPAAGLPETAAGPSRLHEESVPGLLML